ncbi:MAG: radical SAM protein [Dehalococcoidales bacterium]
MGWEEIKRARNRLSGEKGTIIKNWGGRIPVALVYPNSYYLGMSCVGIHVLYSLFNAHSRVVCERVFGERDNKGNLMPLISLESQRPLADFSIIAFSVSYEVDYINIMGILKSSGLPIYAADRDESHPLVIAGGPCISSNPSPLSPFFDLFCIGEAEPVMDQLIEVLVDAIGDKRDELLRALSPIPGIYLPHRHQDSISILQRAENLDEHPATSTILTRNTELSNLYLIEVGRGCSWGCRFCMVGNSFGPARFRSTDTLIEQAREGLKHRKRLGMIGPAVTDHPEIEKLVFHLKEMGMGLSVSSLRMRPLSRILLGELARSQVKSVAFAPEAGSSRLRNLIRKSLSEEDILQAVDTAAGSGIKQIKLYFMIGLPSETEQDTEEIIRLVTESKSLIDRKRSGTRIILKVSPFVPKAHTPLQWLPMARPEQLNRTLAVMKKSLPQKGIRVKSESPAWSQIQAILSRGDGDVSQVLAAVNEFSLSGWREAAADCNLDIDYYAHHTWPADETLPWSMIETGTPKGQLELEMKLVLGTITDKS